MLLQCRRESSHLQFYWLDGFTEVSTTCSQTKVAICDLRAWEVAVCSDLQLRERSSGDDGDGDDVDAADNDGGDSESIVGKTVCAILYDFQVSVKASLLIKSSLELFNYID